MSKHTRGPWLAQIFPKGTIDVISIGGGTVIHWSGFDASGMIHEEDKANAKLIAAAPELLEALRQLYDFAEGDSRTIGCPNLKAKELLERLDG